MGLSEEFLGEFLEQRRRAGGTDPVIATKFAPIPFRFDSGSVVDACRRSLKRLKLDSM